MKTKALLLFITAICLANLGYTAFNFDKNNSNAYEPIKENTALQNNSSFDVMMQVVSHKRCVNCHPSDDRPRQGEDSHVHYFNIQRGANGHGMPNAQCNTCHQSENNNYSGVPGALLWHLAPKSMAWQGLNRVEIAKAMLDSTKNGGRSLEEIRKHLTEDQLVLWAFEPGVNHKGEPREKPPVSKEDFIKAVNQWVAEGAPIPSK